MYTQMDVVPVLRSTDDKLTEIQIFTSESLSCFIYVLFDCTTLVVLFQT